MDGAVLLPQAAGTPGCTKQADAFRDNIKAIRDQGAEVYGISTDSVEAQADFHKEQQLVFILLADPDGVVTEQYGQRRCRCCTLAKRWTFIIGPDLTIRQVQHDVDPTMDAQRVAAEIHAPEEQRRPTPRRPDHAIRVIRGPAATTRG